MLVSPPTAALPKRGTSVVVVVGAPVVVEVVGAAVVVVVMVGGSVVLVVASVVVVAAVVVVVGALKMAVYVVLAAGVLMVCTCTPPSDHQLKVYWPCGEDAPIVRTTPTTPVNCACAVTGWPSRVSWSPDGAVSRRTVVVRGRMSTKVSPVSPAESVARRKMRYHTFADVSPLVAVTNDWGEPTTSLR